MIPSKLTTLPDGRKQLTRYIWQYACKRNSLGRRIPGTTVPVKLLRVETSIYEPLKT
jgi:hypothetical protein